MFLTSYANGSYLTLKAKQEMMNSSTTFLNISCAKETKKLNEQRKREKFYTLSSLLPENPETSPTPPLPLFL